MASLDLEIYNVFHFSFVVVIVAMNLSIIFGEQNLRMPDSP
jgi:hypothetical protein